MSAVVKKPETEDGGVKIWDAGRAARDTEEGEGEDGGGQLAVEK